MLRWTAAPVFLLTWCGLAQPALALDATQAQGQAVLEVRAVEVDLGKIRAAAARVRGQRITPAQRIAEAEILMRSRDYERAIHLLHQVVELHAQGKVPDSAHADALLLLGEAYFQDQQRLAARRQFSELLDLAGERTYAPFAGRALSRLVDVCLRSGDPSGLDVVFARMQQLPARDGTGVLQYARGKAYYARGDLAGAMVALGSVPPNTPYFPQAGYLLGVIRVKELARAASETEPDSTDADGGAASESVAGSQEPPQAPASLNYAGAIEQFRKVTRLAVSTSEHRHVRDLAWMAMGRLYYEMDHHLEAAQAYSHVDRKSPEFSNMLYELAWVYVRLGDFQRAQRALEVQRITDPQDISAADGALLRADLLLRQGEYEQALKLYQAVRKRYAPIREQVERFLAAEAQPGVYYDMLVDEQLTAGLHSAALPPIVLQWARESASDERVFSLMEDMARTRELSVRSRSLAAKLDAVLRSRTRAKAFPELRASLQVTLGLLNKLGHARRLLAQGMDDEAGAQGAGELAQVRAQRRALMQRMAWLPVTPGDFVRRERSGERQWNQISQRLQRLTLATDRLQAIVNALRRVVSEAGGSALAHNRAIVERIRAEVARHERKLSEYRARIRYYQEAVEAARVQVGLGDQRFRIDQRVREQFRRLLTREVQLVAAGADNSGAVEYARAIQPLLARADVAEAYLSTVEQQLEEAARNGAAALRKQVAQEAAAVEGNTAALGVLDEEARALVGKVAMRSFADVRDRLRDVVLRADVGVVQQAWELREEQRIRVQNLHRERAREERKLNAELHEVFEDAGDAEP